MQRRARIGELLSRMVPLSGHDVEEVLQEQTASRRRFGDIALSWGLCRPEHVWDAWAQQSAHGGDFVDLDEVGIDSQAAALLPANWARRLSVIPVRAGSDAVLVATADTPPQHVSDALTGLLGRRIHFIQADQHQLKRMIESYYPA